MSLLLAALTLIVGLGLSGHDNASAAFVNHIGNDDNSAFYFFSAAVRGEAIPVYNCSEPVWLPIIKTATQAWTDAAGIAFDVNNSSSCPHNGGVNVYSTNWWGVAETSEVFPSGMHTESAIGPEGESWAVPIDSSSYVKIQFYGFGRFEDFAPVHVVLEHEFGHALGLAHPFTGGCAKDPDGQSTIMDCDAILLIHPYSVDEAGPTSHDADNVNKIYRSHPASPRILSAVSTGPGEIQVKWKDRSYNEKDFVVTLTDGSGHLITQPTSPANSEGLTIGGLPLGVELAVRVLARDYFGGVSNSSDTITVGTVLPPEPGQPPQISAFVSPLANSFGWNNSNVFINWSVLDATMTTGCSDETISFETAGLVRTCTASNLDGGVHLSTRLIRIDKTDPIIVGSRSPAGNSYGWNNVNVTVHFDCHDVGPVQSGIRSCPGDQTISTEGFGQSRSGTALDFADNAAGATVGGINIDKTPPTVSGNRSPSPNAAGWYNTSPVQVTWKGTDNLSGIQSCDAPSSVAGEGRHTPTGQCKDLADNVGTGSAQVLIDLTPPVTTGALDPPVPDGLKGWYISPVTVTLTATDPDLADGTPGSGVVLTKYRVDEGPWTDYTGSFVVNTNSPDHKVEWFSEDLAGNVEATHEIHFRIDQTRPIFKVPQVANLWLCSQPACPVGTNGVNHFTYGVGFNGRVTDLSPKGEPQRIGSFEYEVRFDAKLVDVQVEPGPLFQRSDVQCTTIPGQGFVQFRCVTKGKPADAPIGPGILANITVTPKPDVYSILIANQGNGIATQLINQDCGLSDLQGHPIQMGSCDNAALTIRYLEGDVNADCVVNVQDQQLIAFRWGSHLGSLLYNSRYDLEPAAPKKGDGDIDAKDLQVVWGRHNTIEADTCANPHAGQDPVDPKATVAPPGA